MTRRKRVLFVLGATLGGFIVYESLGSFIAYTDDAYVRSDLIAIAPQVTGRVVAVHVADNQIVKAGDRLITIDPVPFQLVIAEHRAQIDQARAQVQVNQDEIVTAQDTRASALSAANYARVSQQRIATLSEQGIVARQRLDQTNDELTRAEAALSAADTAIARAQAMKEVNQAALARAEAAMATAEWQLARTRVKSPAHGIVNNLTIRVGDTAQVSVPLIGIVDAAAWRVVANYKQYHLRRFRVGGTAWV